MINKVLLVVVAVLAIALVFSFAGFTGKSISGVCEDSDGGDFPHEPGIVKYTNLDKEHKDTCYAAGGVGAKKYLKEKFCLDVIDSESYLCEGGCLENEDGVGYCGEGEANLLDN